MLVFPAPAAFAASILPRAALRKEGIIFNPKFVASHESVYLNVARGYYAAGGGIERTFDMQDEAVRRDLRILWSTPAYTPHAIAVHPKLPRELALKVREALLGLNDDPSALKMLQTIGFKGVEAAQDADWNDIRQLNITELDTLSE